MSFYNHCREFIRPCTDMDIYDPQTLGIVVFGGFMVISAIGIALVSTFSMKETSYEEALAKQRKELGKMQAPQPARSEKKKKEKASEKKSRSKKKEDKPNGKLPEPEKVPEAVETVSDSDPEPVPEPVAVVAAAVARPLAAEAPPAPSPKDKKKKKVAKVEPAPTQSAAPPPKPAPVLEAVTKEVPVMAVPPVGAPAPTPAPAKAEEPKAEPPSKKKVASKKKAEPAVAADSADAPLYLPYKTLVSTVSSMMFSEGEAQRLIEILTDKAGIVQDTWHTATQKGDPVTALRKQLEEKEKQLSAEQEDAAAAKNRLRELSKELNAEKAKVSQVEARLGSQLSARDQELTALQARMQASYQEHVSETQQLNAKIQSLQEQLEKGPNAQLARLQQENSILRDALNQATSQTESKQNAELAKLRQDCAKLSLELGEKNEALQAEEQLKAALEAKMAAATAQLAQVQAERADSEKALQGRLDEVSEELRTTQASASSLQAELDSVRQQPPARMSCRRDWLAEKAQLQDQITTIEALLEAGQGKDPVTDAEIIASTETVALQQSLEEGSQVREAKMEDMVDSSAEFEQLKISLKERESQVASLEEELKQLKESGASESTGDMEQLHNSLKEKETQVTSLGEELMLVKEELEKVKSAATPSVITTEIEELQKSLKEKEDQVTSLEEELQQLKETEIISSTETAPVHTAEVEELQKSLEEKENQVSSMQVELEQLKEEMEHIKSESNETVAQQAAVVQPEVREALQSLFPHVTVETEQVNWLQEFTQKAHECLSQQSQSQDTQQVAGATTDSSELLVKLKEAEESQSTLQAECDQYRTVLAETEGMLKDLQKSVEDEELVWRAKIAQSEEQLRKALEQVQALEMSTEKMKLENQNTEQLKEQVMLLEAQLEKQLESASSESQNCSEETVQEQTTEKEVEQELEQARRSVTDLQEQLDLLKVTGEASAPETESTPQQEEPTKEEGASVQDQNQGQDETKELTEGTSV
ncbi:hypothetical protein AGOR_G00213290 [Albula goreensis]|uniref:Ribosome receptor lysine/proline rich domain-containing protein n=1 Tax=Albula goreensis TaxID=1534307 RepID=A0A8T3CRL5_9TELE|nr:hypothetical protein AGOR_G00213290 [Albula goreensis]